MSKQKCDYCEKEINAEDMSTLDNGCPACPECVAKQEKESEEADENGRKNHN